MLQNVHLRYLLRNGTFTLYRTNGTYVNAPPTVNRMEYMYSILGLSMIGHIISNIDTINTITGTIMGTYNVMEIHELCLKAFYFNAN